MTDYAAQMEQLDTALGALPGSLQGAVNDAARVEEVKKAKLDTSLVNAGDSLQFMLTAFREVFSVALEGKDAPPKFDAAQNGWKTVGDQSLSNWDDIIKFYISLYWTGKAADDYDTVKNKQGKAVLKVYEASSAAADSLQKISNALKGLLSTATAAGGGVNTSLQHAVSACSAVHDVSSARTALGALGDAQKTVGDQQAILKDALAKYIQFQGQQASSVTTAAAPLDAPWPG